MTVSAPAPAYSFTLRAFHWGVAALIILALVVGLVAVELPARAVARRIADGP